MRGHSEWSGGTAPLCICSLQTEMIDVFICILSGEVRSAHKWSPETHVETHSNARFELTYLKLSTWYQIIQRMLMADVNSLSDMFLKAWSYSLSFTHLLPLSQSLAVCVRSSPCAFCVCLVFVFLSFRSLSLLADLSVLSIHFYRLSLFSSLFSFGRSLSRHLSLS